MSQRNTSVLAQRGPYEASFIQSARAKPQPKPIMYQHLHPVRTLVDEQIRVMRASFSKDTDHPCEGSIHASPHVQRFYGKPGDIDPNHFRTSRSHIAHSCMAELGHCTLRVRAPRRTSIWIGGRSSATAGSGNATKLSAGAV